MNQDLVSVARDLRAKVLAGVELTQQEAADALNAIRITRKASPEGKKRTGGGTSAPRPASELLGLLGVTTK